MKNLRLTAVAAALYATGATALEVDPLVPPEINLGGRVLATVNGTHTKTTTGRNSDSELDIADSSLLFGFSKYLFDDAHYGFGVIGITVPEDGSDVDESLFLHEANVGVGGRSYEVKLGRSRLRNTLINFPLVRDDDLLAFTHVGNASAAADSELYQLFGNVAQAQWWPTKTIGLSAAATARTETDTAGKVTTRGDFNGFNVGVAYSLPESLKFDRGLRYAGIALDRQDVDVPNDRMNAVIAGVIYNLNSNPEADWVLEAQAIANGGVAGVASLATDLDRNRAKSRSLVTSVRFNHRPYLQTRYQAALTLAWKDYSDFAGAKSFAVAPSFVYRLGSRVDWVVQYIYTNHDGALASASGVDSEQRLYTGLAFGFDHTFNESVARRDSILSIEHDMTNIGPVGGGH